MSNKKKSAKNSKTFHEEKQPVGVKVNEKA